MGTDAAYEVQCDCGFHGYVDGEDCDGTDRWTSIFYWTCPKCEADHEEEIDHFDYEDPSDDYED
jgi:hypothetical protein